MGNLNAKEKYSHYAWSLSSLVFSHSILIPIQFVQTINILLLELECSFLLARHHRLLNASQNVSYNMQTTFQFFYWLRARQLQTIARKVEIECKTLKINCLLPRGSLTFSKTTNFARLTNLYDILAFEKVTRTRAVRFHSKMIRNSIL